MSETKYRALADFDYPAGSANVKRALRGDLESVTEWAHVRKGAVLAEPDRETLKSWTDNGLVAKVGAKEVSEDGD